MVMKKIFSDMIVKVVTSVGENDHERDINLLLFISLAALILL